MKLGSQILNREPWHSSHGRWVSSFKFQVTRGGFGLIEIIIVVTIVSLAVVSFGQLSKIAYRLLQHESRNLEAAYLIQEGVEGVQALRDASWNSNIAGLSNGTNYYLTGTSAWSLITTEPPFIRNRFERIIVFSAVNRGASDEITSSGTNDPGTRKVTVTVYWREGTAATTSLSSATYVTNFLQN